MSVILSVAAAAALAGAAHAATRAEPVRSTEYSKCMDAAGGSDPNMRDCSGAELAREDARLNAAYRDLQALVRKDDSVEYVKGRLETLRSAQRAWIASRDADCQAEAYEFGGGTFWYVALNECHLNATQARTAWLLEWIAQERERRQP